MTQKRRNKPDASGRSTAAAQHVRFYRWELTSPAYRSLSLAARAALTELKALYNGSNNGDLFLSVRMAADRICVGRTTAAKALHELCEKGFIRPRQKGAFQWKMKLATTWVLTEFEFAGQLPTKDFMSWGPGRIQNTVPPRGLVLPLKSGPP